MRYDYNETDSSLTVTDLLADVIIKPDGTIQVVDLDELAEAFDKGLLSDSDIKTALFQLNSLLSIAYNDGFGKLTRELDALGL